MLSSLFDFILHIDTHLQALIASYGTWVYALLFGIIFIETGLIIMPFLPGDSLLFAAWSFAALKSLHIGILLVLLTGAAILGDSINYIIGKYFWEKITTLHIKNRPLVKKEHIKKTEQFFTKYGKKAIILARFMPIIRTCIPFVAGIGRMPYRVFMMYNVIWGILRVWSLTLAGYFFGQHPFVREHFEKVILLIIFISILPIVLQLLRRNTAKHDMHQQSHDKSISTEISPEISPETHVS